LGIRDSDLEFKVRGIRAEGFGLRVEGLGLGVWGLGFRV
jgi:hypothetical protein